MGLKRERKVGHESAVCCATSATARAVVPSPSTGSGPGGFPWVSPFATVPFWGYNWSYGALFLWNLSDNSWIFVVFFSPFRPSAPRLAGPAQSALICKQAFSIRSSRFEVFVHRAPAEKWICILMLHPAHVWMARLTMTRFITDDQFQTITMSWIRVVLLVYIRTY